jgi:hypothetical protein
MQQEEMEGLRKPIRYAGTTGDDASMRRFAVFDHEGGALNGWR